MSAFALEDGDVYHTYSAYARGFDALWTMWQWLDRAPLGRNEGDLSWFHRHDQYESQLPMTTTHVASRVGERKRSPMTETATEYNAMIVSEFRANGGRVGGTWEEIPLLLLHHAGATSGVSRVNPVAYLSEGAGYLIWAANGGAPKNPSWYQNLRAHPLTRIEVGPETLEVVAQEAVGEERDRLFVRATDRYPQLADAALKTTRVIPMIVLVPRASNAGT